MMKRIGTLIGSLAVLASATIAHADPCWWCPPDEIPKCSACVFDGYQPGGTECAWGDGTCTVSGDGCAVPTCPPGGGGGGDWCEPDGFPPCPIEILGVILLPGGLDATAQSSLEGSVRVVSGLRGLSYTDVLRRVQGEGRASTGPLELQRWHYSIALEALRGGLVAEDGTGYLLSARRNPAGVHLTVYSASKPDRPVSVGLLSPDEALVFEISIQGRTHLVMITARGAGTGPHEGLRARQVDLMTALAALPQGSGTPMRWLKGSEVGIRD